MKVNCFIKRCIEVRNVPSLQIIMAVKPAKRRKHAEIFFTETEIFFHWFPGLENFACELEICIFLPGYFLLIYSRESDKMEIHSISRYGNYSFSSSYLRRTLLDFIYKILKLFFCTLKLVLLKSFSLWLGKVKR